MPCAASASNCFFDASITFQDFSTELRQSSSAAASAAGCGGHYRLGEGLVHAVEQRPSPLLVYAHLTGGSRDRAGIADAFKQLRLAGADTSAKFQDDADADASHVASIAWSASIRHCGSHGRNAAKPPPRGGSVSVTTSIAWCSIFEKVARSWRWWARVLVMARPSMRGRAGRSHQYPSIQSVRCPERDRQTRKEAFVQRRIARFLVRRQMWPPGLSLRPFDPADRRPSIRPWTAADWLSTPSGPLLPPQPDSASARNGRLSSIR